MAGSSALGPSGADEKKKAGIAGLSLDKLRGQRGPRSHGPQTAQVMPLPGAEPPKRFTNRISPSGLKQAPANSPSFSRLTASSNGSPARPSPTSRSPSSSGM
jgi:hypothetical protein